MTDSPDAAKKTGAWCTYIALSTVFFAALIISFCIMFQKVIWLPRVLFSTFSSPNKVRVLEKVVLSFDQAGRTYLQGKFSLTLAHSEYVPFYATNITVVSLFLHFYPILSRKPPEPVFSPGANQHVTYRHLLSQSQEAIPCTKLLSGLLTTLQLQRELTDSDSRIIHDLERDCSIQGFLLIQISAVIRMNIFLIGKLSGLEQYHLFQLPCSVERIE